MGIAIPGKEIRRGLPILGDDIIIIILDCFDVMQYEIHYKCGI